MLSRLIHLLEENEGEVDLTVISRSLNAQPSAVSGMLETLVQKGRLIEIYPECGVCDSCGLSSRCILQARRIKRYQIASRYSFHGQSRRSSEESVCREVVGKRRSRSASRIEEVPGEPR